VSAGRHDQDCSDRHLGIAAPPTNQVVSLAAGFEPQFGNRGWIVDQLDPYQVEFRFQGIPPRFANHTDLICSIQMRAGLRIH
jgi:hypothetical protein